MNVCGATNIGCRGVCGLPEGHDGEHRCGTSEHKHPDRDRQSRSPGHDRQIKSPRRDR